MALYKKQHYVPRGVLKRWADQEGQILVRLESMEWRYVPFEKQCQENYFYARGKTAKDFEHSVRENIEDPFYAVLNKIDKQAVLSEDENISLIAFFFFQYARIQLLNVNNNEERGSATLDWLASFMRLVCGVSWDGTIREYSKIMIRRRYNIVIGKTYMPTMITDSPASLYDTEHCEFAFGIMPIGRRHWMVIYDENEFERIKQYAEFTDHDWKYLLGLQINNRHACAYAHPEDISDWKETTMRKWPKAEVQHRVGECECEIERWSVRVTPTFLKQYCT